MSLAAPNPAILFTVFEPSGDDHASAVIAELRRRHPALCIHAWGGPRMAAAGASLIQDTVHSGAIGVPGLRTIAEHIAHRRDIARWLRGRSIALHVPVDSPAANFPICKLTRARGMSIIHLVAPQFWAWAPWRIRRLRRLTDHVLCLLPFEEEWFRSRGVRATFIGHPAFDEPVDESDLSQRAASFPVGAPRLALLPGSRFGEITHNFPVLLGAFTELQRRHPGLVGVMVAASDHVERRLREMAAAAGAWPSGLAIVVREVAAAARWADLALAVSGTVTLHVARQRCPMVVLYKLSPLMWHALGRWVVPAEHFALPNIIAGRRIVPELVPYFGGPGRLLDAADALLADEPARLAQRAALDSLCRLFEGRNAAASAADAIEEALGLSPRAPDPVVTTRAPAAPAVH